MNERLLQFIWQFQYFNTSELITDTGESVQILLPGQLNSNQGPDFSDAKIRIGPTTWAGSIELHLKTSDWNKHHHQQDNHYRNVILHVVWEDDGSVNELPVIELKSRIPKLLLQQYVEWMNSTSFIPCEKSISRVPAITWKSWKDRLLVERLLRKAAGIETSLAKNNNHWEETFWWMLAKNFGSKVNGDAFEAMARSIPVNILAKHKAQIHQVEALLLGQAGLLGEKFTEDYLTLLKREYAFLQKKYKLQSIQQPIHFLRMRPGNFPTIRLAQLAMLISGSDHLFSTIKELVSVKEVAKIFDITANDFWHYHYRFDETSGYKKKTLGTMMTGNIIINTVAPVLFAYGNYYNEVKYKEKALQWLEETGAEVNTITRGFQQLGIENRDAFDSQAMIELKNEYCDKKRCLDCALGNFLLKKL